ncbi:NAD(P)-dependent oxidoreductase [Arsukibacterium sp. UBA3155]|uniref:NAD(P)-dependent oxidoreductase n=1 Tax=Arsukibacterium sp. UBA3155 TaxID=1946058 RepID=UPI0025C6560A|nr:NAD(P)-dependent oxidoreductase [Arsukibacterium sp. UBA3155]|tara:strand:- start:66978 stop:67859 length:882 start_codon:yes stop_codon:yes gene_type:complete
MSIKSKAKVAFIGLGVMGYPMAGYLQQKGYQVCVYNRTATKAASWVKQYGGSHAATPAQAAADAELVFLCVGNDDDVRSVVYGDDGVLATMQRQSVLTDHTTASAELARELHAACLAKEVGFLDAPVSGGQAGAQNGALTVMLGGNASDMAKAEAAIMSYSRCAKLLGPAGSGQLAKMVNQICIAGVVQGLAEALNFAQNAGLDGAAVVEVISQGAAQSWQMQNRSNTMLNGKYDFGFAVDWMRKDLGIALNEARKNGSHLPLTALVDQFYSEVQQLGGGRWDTSSLLARLKR